MAYMTPEAVAATWGVSASHVRTLCRRGELHAVKLGAGPRAVWRIPLGAVEVFEAHHANEPDATGNVAMRHEMSQGAYAPVFGGAVPWRHEQIEGRPTESRRSRTRKNAARG